MWRHAVQLLQELEYYVFVSHAGYTSLIRSPIHNLKVDLHLGLRSMLICLCHELL